VLAKQSLILASVSAAYAVLAQLLRFSFDPRSLIISPYIVIDHCLDIGFVNESPQCEGKRWCISLVQGAVLVKVRDYRECAIIEINEQLVPIRVAPV
jgi:hypothetical protein